MLFRSAVVEDARTNGEFFCFVDRVGEAGIDQMEVRVEVPSPDTDRAVVREDLERRMKEVLGVKVTVTAVGKGELDAFTGTSQTSKIKRVMDRRTK